MIVQCTAASKVLKGFSQRHTEWVRWDGAAYRNDRMYVQAEIVYRRRSDQSQGMWLALTGYCLDMMKKLGVDSQPERSATQPREGCERQTAIPK